MTAEHDPDSSAGGGMDRGEVVDAEIVADNLPATLPPLGEPAGKEVARWQRVTLLPPTWRTRWAAR